MIVTGEGERNAMRGRNAGSAGGHSFKVLVFAAAWMIFSGPILTGAQKRPAAPLNERQIEGLVEGGVYSGRIALLVEQRGIDFKPADAFLRRLREDGAQEMLIRALVATRSEAGPAGTEKNQRAVPQQRRDDPGLRRSQLASRLSLGEQLELQRMWPQAATQYRAAVNLAPRSVSAHLALARVLSAETQWAEAAGQYREAIRLQPDLASSHTALADLLMESGDVNGAIDEYREAVRLDPKDADTHREIAAILYSRGDLKDAVAEYQVLDGLEPNDPDVHYRLGLALYAESDLGGAADEFRQAVRLQPDFDRAHAALGDALLKQGDRRGALEEYRQSAKSDSPTLQATFDWLSKNLSGFSQSDK